MLQFFAGMALIAVAGVMAYALWPRPKLPSGWEVFRPPQDVMALAEFSGEIWAGGRDGLMAFSLNGEAKGEQAPAGIDLRYVSSMLLDQAAEVLWIGHMEGLASYDGQGWATFSQADGLPHGQVLALEMDRQGGLWIGTPAGVARYQAGAFTIVNLPGEVPFQAVSVITLDSQGRIWIGNGHTREGGLAMFDGSGWRSFATLDGLPHSMITSIHEAADGSIWVGTGFSALGGAGIFDGSSWHGIGRDDGLAGGKVRSVYQDASGRMWLGSEYDGIAYSQGNGWRVLTPAEGLSGWEVKAMLEDGSGNLWLGTENGLTRISQAALDRLAEGAGGP